MHGRARDSLACLLAAAVVATPAAGHVDYVTEEGRGTVQPLSFLVDVLSNPVNLSLVAAGGVGVLAVVVGYLRLRPVRADVAVFRETLAGYADLVPWMLRLSVGLPLVGAGFGGYLFTPAVPSPAARIQVVIGFLVLFGLATRAVALGGLALYLAALATDPRQLLALEYVPGFVAIALLGSGRPSADHVLKEVASAEGTLYGSIDPVHRVAAWLDRRLEAWVAYAPTVLRVGVGLSFFYLGLAQKLGDPGSALSVVEKYGLTAIVPVEPGLWVVGAGLVEMGVGVALVLGLFTRASAATAFLMLTLTLFGLPDDPVLAHVTLFGMTSALVTLGGGPLSLDRRLSSHGAPADPGPVLGALFR